MALSGCVGPPDLADVVFKTRDDTAGGDGSDGNATGDNDTREPKAPVARMRIADEKNQVIFESKFDAGDDVVKGDKGTVRAGTNVTFNAGDSDGRSSDIISYFWDFGDGSRGNGKQVVRFFEVAGGVFKVKLKVTNLDGLSDDQIVRLPVIPYKFPEDNETVMGSIRVAGPQTFNGQNYKSDQGNGVYFHVIDVDIKPDDIDGELRLQWLNITLRAVSDLDSNETSAGQQPGRLNDFDIYLYNDTGVEVSGHQNQQVELPKENNANFTPEEKIVMQLGPTNPLPPGKYALVVHLVHGAEAKYECWIYRKYKLVNPQVNAILGINE
ncbi:MAG: PKD domain-containing protein [Euryarchaeota archaeon]|nr:PKD domain-containing protein [Euryarchaeota archaeon]